MNYPNGIPALAGDVVITSSPPLTLANWIRHPRDCAFKALLYRFQRAAFPSAPDRRSWWATHTRTLIGQGEILNVTHPRARIEKLTLPAVPCSVWRYKSYDQWNAADLQALRDLAHQLDGTKYDITQLVEMGLNIIFDEQIRDGRRLLHSSQEDVVCSVGSHLLLLAAHESAKRRGEILLRPLGEYDPATGKNSAEATPPCKFLNHPLTMRCIYISH